MIFSTESAYCNTPNQLITDIRIYDNDTTYKFEYLYDDYKNMILETKSYLNGSVWENMSQSEWFYSQNTCTSRYERIWKSGEWKNTYLYEIIPNPYALVELHSVFENGNKIEKRKEITEYIDLVPSQKQEFVKSDNNWILTTKTVFNPDSGYPYRKLSSTIITSKTGNDSIRYENRYTYNSDESLNTYIQRMAVNSADFQNVSYSKWYYTPGTKQIASLRSKVWNANISKWENSQMTAYEYDRNNKLENEIYYHWKTMFWEKDISYNYKYDTSGNIIKKQLMLPIYNEWRNTISINYNDKKEDQYQLIESVLGFWGGKSGDYVSSFIPFSFNGETMIKKAKQLKINYLIYDNITNPESHSADKNNLINIFPNPSEGIFYFDKQKYDLTSWTVSDLHGVIVKKSGQIMQTSVIDLTDLPRGIYLFTGILPNKVLTQKLIKQ